MTALVLILGGVGFYRISVNDVARTAPIPAFPGAEGFGAMTPGGRGGRVIEVTNLNDRGPGSLRACAEADGPRICVFRVAGTIEVQSRINIWNPYITIAGQTAPGDGITLKNGDANLQGPLAILTHDVIIRYLRSRPGPSPTPSSNIDAITILHQEDEDHPNDGTYNIIIDHVSFSWATDEVVNLWYDVHDITIQWSIVAEGLHCSTHPEGCHSKGMLVGSEGAGNITLHHNLFAHNEGRNPLIKTEGLVDFVNNVIYAPATIAAAVDGEFRNGAVGKEVPVNFVGNQVFAPNGDEQVYGIFVLSEGTSIYVKGNMGPYRTDETQDEALFVRPANNGRSYLAEKRYDAPTITSSSAVEAYTQVLAQAGATQGLSGNGTFFWRQDPVDARIIDEVKEKTGGVIDDPSEVGGWPELDPGTPYADTDYDGMADEWELIHFENLERGSPEDSGEDFDGDGYTDLEEFLNGTDPKRAF